MSGSESLKSKTFDTLYGTEKSGKIKIWTASVNENVDGTATATIEYGQIDGKKQRFTETTGPIVFTLFVSPSKDIIHCVKVSNINPNAIKRFFGKFVNEDTERLQMRGNAKAIYEKISEPDVSIPKIIKRTR